MNEVPELLQEVCFTIARDGPDLYPKALERLGVYVCATYKNGADLEMCLEVEELILPEEPVLPENPMAHQRQIWDLCATTMIKNEDTLRQNMRSLYVVVMSLCDANVKDKIKMKSMQKSIAPGIPLNYYRSSSSTCT